MGTKKFNINDIKKQIENADNDQLNDQFSEALTKNFDKVGELNRQVSELNTKVKNLTEKVTTLTDAAYTAVYTFENSLRLVMSPETKKNVRDACEKIGVGVTSHFDTKSQTLLTSIETKGNDIVKNIDTKGASVCSDIDTHAKSFTDDMEKTGKKIISNMKQEEMRVCISPSLFMGMLVGIILMVGMLVMIACFNQESIHSSVIDTIYGWFIAAYVVFIVLMVWLSVRNREQQTQP